MKKIFVVMLSVFLLLGVVFTGCSKKDTGTGPSAPAPASTATMTETPYAGTPTNTATITMTNTASPTDTPYAGTPTNTPTNTASPTATATATMESTVETAEPTATSTETAVSTDTPTDTASPTATPTATMTLTLVPTSTPPTAPNLGGSIVLPDFAEGKNFVIIIDDDANTANGYVAAYFNVCDATLVQYFSIEVPEDIYYVYAFVDMNNSGLDGPDGTDYFGAYRIVDGGWIQVTTPNLDVNFALEQLPITVTLNVTVPSPAPGAEGFFGLFNVKGIEMFEAGPVTGSDNVQLPAGTSFKLTITVDPADAGTYYLTGFADSAAPYCAGDPCMPQAGDFIGIYGGSVDNWPVVPNLAVYGDVTVDFTMAAAVDNVSGTVYLPSSVTDKNYLISVSAEKLSDEPDFIILKEGTVSGSSFAYSLFSMFPGNYYICAFVDMDDSGWDNPGQGPVTPGDYAGIYGVPTPMPNWEDPFPAEPNAALPGSGFDITCDRVPDFNLEGRITMPEAAPGKAYKIVADNDTNTANGYVAAITGILGSSTNLDYRMEVPDGSYYVYAFVDMNDSGLDGPDGTDYFGTYMGWDSFETPVTGINIDLAQLPITVTLNVTIPADAEGRGGMFGLFGVKGYEMFDTGPIAGTENYICPAGASFKVTLTVAPEDAGSYYLTGFVKVGAGNPDMPEAGDYLGIYGGSYNNWPAVPNVAVNGDTTIDFTLETAVNNILGTVTLPYSLASVRNYMVTISTGPLTDSPQYLLSVTGTVSAFSGSFEYSMFHFIPGDHYITAVIDVNNTGFDGFYDVGDFVGIYGVTPPIENWASPYPPAPNAAIPGTDFDITCDEYTQTNISGSFGLPEPAPGKQYSVVVTSAPNTYSAKAAEITGTLGASGTVSFSAAVPNGSYYVYVFVDMNGDGIANGPNGTDYYGYYGAEGSWSQITTPATGVDIALEQIPITVTLNVTVPSPAPGVEAGFGIFANKGIEILMGPGPVAGTDDFTCPAGTAFKVTMTVNPEDAGEYYLLGFVKVVSGEDAFVTEGDYVGIYGGTVENWPENPNVEVYEDSTFDFVMTTAVNNVSGTVTLPASVTNRDYFIITAHNKEALDMGMWMATDAGTITSGSSFQYSLFVFFPADYYIVAMVDMAGIELPRDPVPDDYVGAYGVAPPLNWEGDILPDEPNAALPGSGFDITCDRVPDFNLEGRITMPEAAPGKAYKIVADNDTNTANGYVAAITGILGSSTNLDYRMEVPDGSYYVYAFVDMNDSGLDGPDGTDYFGSFGSQISTPDNEVDFTLYQLPITVTLNVTLPAGAPGARGGFGLFTGMTYEIFESGPVAGTDDWSCPSGTSFKVTITVAPEDAGTYYLIGFIKIAAGNPEIPEVGDFIGIYGGNENNIPVSANLEVTGDITIAFPMVAAQGNVTGRVYLPDTLPGTRNYMIAVSVEPLAGDPEFMYMREGTASGSYFDYSILAFIPGYHYITAIVDVDQSGWDNPNSGPVSEGDYAGIYGVTPPIMNWMDPYPMNPNANTPGSGFDITADTVPSFEPAPTQEPVPLPETPTGTVIGQLTIPAGQMGKGIMIIVDMDLIPENGNDFMMMAGVVASNGAHTHGYMVENVPSGDYYVYAAIIGEDGPPVAGDCLGIYGATYPAFPASPNLTVVQSPAFTTADITMVVAQNNVSGRVHIPEAALGKEYLIMLDRTLFEDGGEMGMAIGTINTTDTYFDYSLLLPLPGNYYIYGVVDVTGDGLQNEPLPGDYVGHYNFPSPVYMTPGGDNTGKDFKLREKTDSGPE